MRFRFMKTLVFDLLYEYDGNKRKCINFKKFVNVLAFVSNKSELLELPDTTSIFDTITYVKDNLNK